jgi:hypothetical protein
MSSYAVILHKLMGAWKLPGHEFYLRGGHNYLGSLCCWTLKHFVALFVNAVVIWANGVGGDSCFGQAASILGCEVMSGIVKSTSRHCPLQGPAICLPDLEERHDTESGNGVMPFRAFDTKGRLTWIALCRRKYFSLATWAMVVKNRSFIYVLGEEEYKC